MCIKESCRLFAPVPMISRTLDRTYEIDGHFVPEGIVCIDHERFWLVTDRRGEGKFLMWGRARVVHLCGQVKSFYHKLSLFIENWGGGPHTPLNYPSSLNWTRYENQLLHKQLLEMMHTESSFNLISATFTKTEGIIEWSGGWAELYDSYPPSPPPAPQCCSRCLAYPSNSYALSIP